MVLGVGLQQFLSNGTQFVCFSYTNLWPGVSILQGSIYKIYFGDIRSLRALRRESVSEFFRTRLVYKELLKRGGKLLELERPGLIPRPHFTVVAVVITEESVGGKSKWGAIVSVRMLFVARGQLF